MNLPHRKRDRRRLLVCLAFALALHAAGLWLLQGAGTRRAVPSLVVSTPAPLAARLVDAPVPSPPAAPAIAESARPRAAPTPGPPPDQAFGRRLAAASPATEIAIPPTSEPGPMSAAPRQAALPLRAAVLSDAAAAAGMVLPANETSGTVAAGADAVQAHKPGRAVGVAAAAGAGQSAPTEAVAAAATAVAGGTAGTATTIAARANSAAGGSSPIADLCPHIVKAVPPPRAVQAGLGGMVLVRAAIKGGKVRRVEILKSEPVGLFDGAVRAALAQYVCRDQGDVEVLAEQWFEFKLAE